MQITQSLYSKTVPVMQYLEAVADAKDRESAAEDSRVIGRSITSKHRIRPS